MLTTRPSVSSSIFRADSSASPLSSLLPTKTTRSNCARTRPAASGKWVVRISVPSAAIASIRRLLRPHGPEPQRGRQQHSRETRGHGEALVVAGLRQHDGVGVPQAAGAATELAFGVARDDQMMTVLDLPLRELERGHALRTVAGAREVHHQSRRLRRQRALRACDDVRRRDRFGLAPGLATSAGARHLPM